MDVYNIIKRPILTEKSQYDNDMNNAYHFEVAIDANKIQVKKAIETIYEHKGIKVTKVRIINKHPKKRRYRFREGYTRKWKKAIVFVNKEQKLEIY